MARKVEWDAFPRSVRRFLHSLAEELRRDAEVSAVASHAEAIHNPHEFLHSVVSGLPPSKLRSALLEHLQNQPDRIISILQKEIVLAAEAANREQNSKELDREAHWNHWRRKLLEITAGWCSEQDIRTFPEFKVRFACASHEAPLTVVWAMAALELDAIKADNSDIERARVLANCLKNLVVGHSSSSIAIAAFLPLVLVILGVIQEHIRDLQTQKNLSPWKDKISTLAAIKAIIHEVFGFMIVSQRYVRGPLPKHVQNADLVDAFNLLLTVTDSQKFYNEYKDLHGTDRMKIIAPLVSTCTLESLCALKSVKLATLSKIAVVEFVILQLILEVLLGRESSHERVLETLRRTAIHGLSASPGNSLILDLILSNLSMVDLLDDKEKNLVVSTLLQALLVLEERPFGAVSKDGKKSCEGFFKKIAAARNLIRCQSVQGIQDVLDRIFKIHVPSLSLDSVKAVDLTTKLPKRAMRSNSNLIGWLLHLGSDDFEAIIDYVNSGQPNSDKVEAMKERLPKKVSMPMAKVELDSLFFVDTVGEARDGEVALDELIHDGDDKDTQREKETKKRKRKREHVLFHRCKQLVLEDNQGTHEVFSSEEEASFSQEEDPEL